MYLHVVLYAYLGGNPENNTNVANSWIYFRKDGYNTASDFELTTRPSGYSTNNSLVFAWNVGYDDFLVLYMGLNGEFGARPTFYLSSKAKIFNGQGTKENPYLINIEEI